MNTSQQEIAVRAYELWREGGSQNGHHEEHWRQAERELAPVDVILASAGDNKIALIKEVRSLTGLDLVSARALVETAPQTLMRGAKRVEAEKIRQRLATVGAKIEVAVP